MNEMIIIEALGNGQWDVKVVEGKGLKDLNRKLGKKGQGLVEYIMIVVVMALLAVGGMRALGTKTHNAFVQASDTLNDDMNTASTSGAQATRIADGG